MSDDEFDDDDEPQIDEEELDEGDLDEGFDVVDVVDVADVVDVVDVEDVDEVDEVVVDVVDVVDVVAGDDEAEELAVEEDGDEIVDLDEELHPDDVEEALDVVLRERTAKAGLEDEEDEEEPDDRGEGSTRIVPRRPGEFLCSSCFLVLPRHQLADEKAMRCRDCA